MPVLMPRFQWVNQSYNLDNCKFKREWREAYNNFNSLFSDVLLDEKLTARC